MKKYEKAELELIDIDIESAILTSCGDDGSECDETYIADCTTVDAAG